MPTTPTNPRPETNTGELLNYVIEIIVNSPQKITVKNIAEILKTINKTEDEATQIVLQGIKDQKIRISDRFYLQIA